MHRKKKNLQSCCDDAFEPQSPRKRFHYMINIQYVCVVCYEQQYFMLSRRFLDVALGSNVVPTWSEGIRHINRQVTKAPWRTPNGENGQYSPSLNKCHQKRKVQKKTLKVHWGFKHKAQIKRGLLIEKGENGEPIIQP